MMHDAPRLSWWAHIEIFTSNCRRSDILKVLASVKCEAIENILRSFYIAFIRSKIDYNSFTYSSSSKVIWESLTEFKTKQCTGYWQYTGLLQFYQWKLNLTFVHYSEKRLYVMQSFFKLLHRKEMTNHAKYCESKIQLNITKTINFSNSYMRKITFKEV